MIGPRIATTLNVLFAFAIPCFAAGRIKLASVSSEYIPTAGSELPEPVSMASFPFEVNEETGRARIVVDYTYPDQPVFGTDGGSGPKPTYIQLPELRYDQHAQTVVYETKGARTVCAEIRKARFLFWQRTVIEPTGGCVVSARLVDHVEDDGWNIRTMRAIDIFFQRSMSHSPSVLTSSNMTKFQIIVGILALTCFTVGQAENKHDPTVKVDVNLVRINTVVIDQAGRARQPGASCEKTTIIAVAMICGRSMSF